MVIDVNWSCANEHSTKINKKKNLLILISLPWQSISKWWFITNDGCIKPPRWLCNGIWCASGPLMSAMTIQIFSHLCLSNGLWCFYHEQYGKIKRKNLKFFLKLSSIAKCCCFHEVVLLFRSIFSDFNPNSITSLVIHRYLLNT